MKEWHVLLDYIDSYVYNHDTEEIMIKNSPDAPKALALYQKMLKDYSMEEDEYLKWSFDIALDCVREMNDKDRHYLTHSYEVDFHGYGMFVRNRYIHCSKKHRYFLCADGQSSKVLGLIYTILHIYYNYFNKELCELLHNFTYKDIIGRYSDKFAFIEEYTLQLTDSDCKLTATEMLHKISERVRRELGAEGFKKIFIEVIKECGKDCLPPDKWLNVINKLYSQAPTYTKEYHQVIALKEIGLIRDLVCDYPINKFENKNDCKTFIDNNLGLRDEDALSMADCMWSAFKETDI